MEWPHGKGLAVVWLHGCCVSFACYSQVHDELPAGTAMELEFSVVPIAPGLQVKQLMCDGRAPVY